MATAPITLTPATGGPTYQIVKGHLVMLYTGAWVLDVEIDAESLQQNNAMPSGKVSVMFGGVPMIGTVDPASSGTFGPTAMARIVGGANGWSTSAPAQDWHADNGVLSTVPYQSIATAVGETLVDLAPATLGVDVVYNGVDPAMSIFGDTPWFVDVAGITNVGPRPVQMPDPSLVIRDWDPIVQKASFACDTLLFPNTTLVDPRFNGSQFTVWNVEQIFDASGSTGWAWSNATPVSLIVESLKAAAMYWTRASYLRAYRYRLVQYQGNGPGGGPSRMALQAVTPAAGMPDLVPIAPWSGVAGVVSQLAPSQEVLVVFENADPTLPRVIGYSLIASDGQALGLPLKTSVDAQTELDVGPTVPLVNLGASATVNIAGGSDALVLKVPYTGLLTALGTFAASLTSATTIADVNAAGTVLTNAIVALPPPATVKTKAT